ncbi:MAG: single-stranded DNA-binding protein [Eubacterium sp.]|nr:single-stranded DNA-binding protein [Eubacterium sp.]
MMNKIMLQGRLVREPDISPEHADDPKRIRCVFNVAVKRDYKKENEQDTDFFRCVAFGQPATRLVRHGKKGGRILIEGRVEINTVENNNGSRSVYAQVIVNQLWILDYRQDSNEASSARPYDPYENSGYFASVPDPSQVPFLNA